MCGRFQMTEEAFLALQAAFDLPAFWQPMLPLGMIYPTNQSLVLLSAAPDNPDAPAGVAGALYAFGLQSERGGKKKLLINARSETVFETWTFRDLIRTSRCVIPCAWFYEWSPYKERFSFFEENHPVLYLAGIYKNEQFIILTTAANESVAPVHNRMPVILAEKDVKPWLDEPAKTEYFLKRREPLLVARGQEDLRLF